MLLINQIKLNLNESEKLLETKICKKLHLKNDELLSYKIYRKSLDARKELAYVYTLIIEVKNEDKCLRHKDVSTYTPFNHDIEMVKTDVRPIIVGYGPAGIFATQYFLDAGIKPIIFERGSRIAKRRIDVEDFFNEGILDPESNVQFGEGGAGTFSDAKLTTRVKDITIEYITAKFIKFGAKEEIAYDAHPHIGTDCIQEIITKMTDDAISRGAEFHFDEKITDFIIENDEFKAVISDKGTYYSDYLVLACGHSAYDIMLSLNKRGVYLEAKDFSIGFRVEHPQSFIDHNQYKCNNPKLPAAEYFLRAKTSVDKGVYSFCMCPGGFVVPSSSELETIVTNGMSYSKRDNNLANSALLVQVSKEDFGDNLFAGFDYIHEIEARAYKLSGSYQALSQNISDYMYNDLKPLKFKSSYPLGTSLYNLNDFFDSKLNIAFKEALLHFDHVIPGFIEEGIMVGPETRSSCPVRIKRNLNLVSISTNGLYPCGEGAGYAGGIISSSIDGVKVARTIANILKEAK